MRMPSRPRTLAFVAVALLAPRAFAADLDNLKNTTPAERANAQTAMMKTKLELTDEQLPKVAALNLKYAERMEPILKGSEGRLVKMRSARDIQAAKEAEMKGLLSPEQFQKFQAAKEEMRAQMAERIKERRAQGAK